jgi:hypothetical protein
MSSPHLVTDASGRLLPVDPATIARLVKRVLAGPGSRRGSFRRIACAPA